MCCWLHMALLAHRSYAELIHFIQYSGAKERFKSFTRIFTALMMFSFPSHSLSSNQIRSCQWLGYSWPGNNTLLSARFVCRDRWNMYITDLISSTNRKSAIPPTIHLSFNAFVPARTVLHKRPYCSIINFDSEFHTFASYSEWCNYQTMRIGWLALIDNYSSASQREQRRWDINSNMRELLANGMWTVSTYPTMAQLHTHTHIHSHTKCSAFISIMLIAYYDHSPWFAELWNDFIEQMFLQFRNCLVLSSAN